MTCGRCSGWMAVLVSCASEIRWRPSQRLNCVSSQATPCYMTCFIFPPIGLYQSLTALRGNVARYNWILRGILHDFTGDCLLGPTTASEPCPTQSDLGRKCSLISQIFRGPAMGQAGHRLSPGPSDSCASEQQSDISRLSVCGPCPRSVLRSG